MSDITSFAGGDAPLRVVAVSGSLHEPSKTTALVREILAEIEASVDVETQLVELATIGPLLSGTLSRDQLPAEVEDVLRAIENADLLVVASPVYRASFTGLFKHLFDFVGQYSLIGQPVLIAATGGGERHALILDHQLRPLFSFFQALTLPLGVYASTSDFDGYTLVDGAVKERVRQAVARAIPLLAPSARSRVQVSDRVSAF